MLSNCVALYLFLGLFQVICAQPVAYTDKSTASTALNDVEGLQELLDMCKLNPDLCVSGGQVDGVTERQLHKLGMTRIQSHFILQILRVCLEDMDECDKDVTISAMIQVQKQSAVFKHDSNGGKLKRHHYSRAFAPSARHNTGVRKGLSMYSRYGRTDKSMRRQSRSTSLSLIRRKRNLHSLFHEVTRQVCVGRRCRNKPDTSEDELPSNSEW